VAAPSFAKIAAVALDTLRVSPDDPEIPPAGAWAPKPAKPLRAAASTPAQPKKEEIEWPPRAAVASLATGRGPGEAAPPGFASGTSAEIPDLFGASLRAAVGRLAERGYRALSVGRGYVVAQDPAAGSSAARGTICRLTLSMSPPDPPPEEKTDPAAPAPPSVGAVVPASSPVHASRPRSRPAVLRARAATPVASGAVEAVR
jgi:PASTA domain